MIMDKENVNINEVKKALNKHKSVKIGDIIISNIPNYSYRIYNIETGDIKHYNSLEQILKDYNNFEKNEQMSIF